MLFRSFGFAFLNATDFTISLPDPSIAVFSAKRVEMTHTYPNVTFKKYPVHVKKCDSNNFVGVSDENWTKQRLN